MISVIKWASIISFCSAFVALICAPTRDWSVAGMRALMVFSGVFLWSALALKIVTKILPDKPGSAGGSPMEGSGPGKFIDLEKQTIDRSKLQELLR